MTDPRTSGRTRGAEVPAVLRAVAARAPVAPVGFAPTARARRRPAAPGPQVAVSLHDVEPATFDRVALVRDWLADLGVDRVTLLVIPAPDLHPFDRNAELAAWLRACAAAGDDVAQHGFTHERSRPRRWGRGSAEPDDFAGLDATAARARIDAGRRLLELAGVRPSGFVAPGFHVGSALRRAIALEYPWWATADAVHLERGHRTTRARAVGIRAAAGGPGRAGTTRLRRHERRAGELLRLELHPADFDVPRHALALDAAVRRAVAARSPVTYAELAGVL